MSHQVLARKYRPKNFDEMIGQQHVVKALSNALNKQYLHHAYLFTGTRGVGKTTLARIIAKCLNCEKGVSASPCEQCTTCHEIDNGRFPDLYEIDAASRTKVEDTRDILDNVQYTPTKGRYKVYLIDEVHMLSTHSFNALLKTLEEPPEHVKFILATTDYQKLPATILSRCLQFHLTQMPGEMIAGHIQTILQKEKIEFDTQATELLGRAANGSMRDALSLLDQSIAFGNGAVKTEDVKDMLGTIEPTAIYDLLNALAEKNGDNLLKAIEKLNDQGVDFAKALADLLSVLHQITLIQTIKRSANKTPIAQLAQTLSPEDVQLFYQIGLIGQRDLAFSPTPRIGFEMTMLRMLTFYPGQASGVKTTIAAQQTTTQPAAQTTTKTAPATSTLKNWVETLPQLKLSGIALALAQQCSLQEINDEEIILTVTAKQKPLLVPKQVERINAAVESFLQKKIKVRIGVGQQSTMTPAQVSEKNQEEKQQTARDAIMRDGHVQKIMHNFDATVIEESIKS